MQASVRMSGSDSPGMRSFNTMQVFRARGSRIFRDPVALVWVPVGMNGPDSLRVRILCGHVQM